MPNQKRDEKQREAREAWKDGATQERAAEQPGEGREEARDEQEREPLRGRL